MEQAYASFSANGEFGYPLNKRQRLETDSNQHLLVNNLANQMPQAGNSFYAADSSGYGEIYGSQWDSYSYIPPSNEYLVPDDVFATFPTFSEPELNAPEQLPHLSGSSIDHIEIMDRVSNSAVEEVGNLAVQFETPHSLPDAANPPCTQQVCYGMICDMPIFTMHSSLLNCDSAIKLKFSAPNRLIEYQKDSVFGELDDRTAKILVNLSSEPSIAFQINFRTLNRRAIAMKKGARKPGANDLQCVIDIVLYGPEEFADSTGDFLTKCGIYLQDPLNCNRDVVYMNPHLISRGDARVMTSSLHPIDSVLDLAQAIPHSDIFSELSSDEHLSLTDAPNTIKTSLYSHQKKALTFMLKREDGWHYDGSLDDLWVKDIDETGVMYTNMITEASQRFPPVESRGGLLADQMGLGKSLTMIALIALNTSKSTQIFIPYNEGHLKRLKSTLLVVPYSLVQTWNTQLKRHLRSNTLKWTVFHGSKRRKTLGLGHYDIVITTFEVLSRQQKKHVNPQHKEDTLYSFYWHRIVLDEAHTIRNRSTAMARSCCALPALNRWAITGTPIQNRVTDFSSLLEFIKVHPFSDPKVFDTEIAKPWLKSEARDASRMKKLVNCVSLSRTKAIIELPKREDVIILLQFSLEEQKYYDQVREGTIKRIDEALSSNPLKCGQYVNALQWLNELRLICNHGLAHHKREVIKINTADAADTQAWNKSIANKAFETIASAGEASCSVCGNMLGYGADSGVDSDYVKPFLAACLTLTCGPCVKDSPNGQLVPTCAHAPICKSAEVSWTPDHSNRNGLVRRLPSISPDHVSTKIKRLLKDVQSNRPEEKSVVFSYWTFTLDLIEALLQQYFIPYTRIDGQHSAEKREEAIQKFQIDENIRVILVSITCGGAGLDLTAASVAYLLEPQWNPMMEEQALCRIHRLGQQKEVKTVRYRIQGSFEEKVVATQELKKQIAAEAFVVEKRRDATDNAKRLHEIRRQLD